MQRNLWCYLLSVWDDTGGAAMSVVKITPSTTATLTTDSVSNRDDVHLTVVGHYIDRLV